jgi:hypothetical protein
MRDLTIRSLGKGASLHSLAPEYNCPDIGQSRDVCLQVAAHDGDVGVVSGAQPPE